MHPGLRSVRAQAGRNRLGNAHQGRFPVGAGRRPRARRVGEETHDGRRVFGARAFPGPGAAPPARGRRGGPRAGQRHLRHRGRLRARGRGDGHRQGGARRDGRREPVPVAPRHAGAQRRQRRAPQASRRGRHGGGGAHEGCAPEAVAQGDGHAPKRLGPVARRRRAGPLRRRRRGAGGDEDAELAVGARRARGRVRRARAQRRRRLDRGGGADVNGAGGHAIRGCERRR
mmetsp:Transcript_7274/g.30264  ORF Transcript_7274/g.30264 Transcript_7274/m.30264 type:complete len:229 (+) Transcript_7274:1358-2044(+)